MHSEDILQPILKQEDLVKLQTIYKDIRPLASHIYNYLATVIKRGTLEPNSDRFTIFVPHGKLDNGTFIGIEKGDSVVMYTLEADSRGLLEALEQTKRFDWTQSWILYSIAEPHYSKVVDVLKRKGFQSSITGNCGIWWLDRKEALHLSIGCPDEVYVAPLEPVHAAKINSVWPSRFPGSENYLINIIQFGGGYGVFLKSNNLLVSWALHNPIGIGNIQTVKEYMKKGYGTLVGKYISKKIAEQGGDPLGTVRLGNVASETMFSKIGFKMVEKAFYAFPKDYVPAED